MGCAGDWNPEQRKVLARQKGAFSAGNTCFGRSKTVHTNAYVVHSDCHNFAAKPKKTMTPPPGTRKTL